MKIKHNEFGAELVAVGIPASALPPDLALHAGDSFIEVCACGMLCQLLRPAPRSRLAAYDFDDTRYARLDVRFVADGARALEVQLVPRQADKPSPTWRLELSELDDAPFVLNPMIDTGAIGPIALGPSD